jgi:hypothetical protein
MNAQVVTFEMLLDREQAAHGLLDDLGVPRKTATGLTLTVYGRLDWLRNVLPGYWKDMRYAAFEEAAKIVST